MTKAVLIGSFRKDFQTIGRISAEFKDLGVEVLSPRQGSIINPDAEFITLSTDRFSGARAIQDEVLEKITAADFIYLVNPSGSVGLSAAFEIGYTRSINKPVYALSRPDDATLQHYVEDVISPQDLIRSFSQNQLKTREQYHLFFDADDTLWDDQGKLQRAEKNAEHLVDQLLGRTSLFQKAFIDIEHENIPIIGFGFHSYLFSMAEAFFREPHTHHAKSLFLKIIAELIQSYLHGDPELFPKVSQTLLTLRNYGFRLHLVTRGIRNEQMEKLNKSGLTDMFDSIHVVARKDIQLYQSLLSQLGTTGDKACMIGNSLKSDVNPALASGMAGVLIPTANQWAYDSEDCVTNHARFKSIKQFSDLVDLFREKATL